MKRTIRFILLCAFMAIGLAACSSRSFEPADGSNILIRFDRADYERMKQFIDHFHEGKGDNLMVIPQTIEGGPIIYDLQSDGEEIKVTRDDTRDSYSSSSGKTTYICRAIDWKEADGIRRTTVSQCDNVDGAWGLFSFEE